MFIYSFKKETAWHNLPKCFDYENYFNHFVFEQLVCLRIVILLPDLLSVELSFSSWMDAIIFFCRVCSSNSKVIPPSMVANHHGPEARQVYLYYISSKKAIQSALTGGIE